MDPNLSSHARRDLVIGACVVIALSLLVVGAATGLEWMTAHWNVACRRLLHIPVPTDLSSAWRGPRAAAPCLPEL